MIGKNLFGENLADTTIKRMQMFEPADGYYLAFSGGKDSTVILDLAKKARVKFDAHYSYTTVDPPELYRFIKNVHPEVEIIRPKKSMWMLIDENNCPPTRTIRYCCREVKETGGSGRIVMTGIRWAESNRRAKRSMNERCMNDPTKKYFHPIIDWKTSDVWDYIRSRKLPYCKLYDEGFRRIGCVLCPMSSQNNKKRDMDRFPKIADAWRRAIARVHTRRLTDGTMDFSTADQYFKYWLSGKAKEKDNEPSFPIFD